MWKKKRSGKRAKNKGRACSSTCSIDVIGTSFKWQFVLSELLVLSGASKRGGYAVSNC